MQHLIELTAVMSFFILRVGIPLILIVGLGTIIERHSKRPVPIK